MSRSSRRRDVPAAIVLFLASLAAAQTDLSNLPNLSSAAATRKGNGATKTAFHLTGLPSIAGAGIPKLHIPYTAGAPFMQKASVPEGTFFIAVGAALAFLGACVLLWRIMVAWSIKRSVKRTSLTYMGSRSEGAGSSTTYGRWNGGRKTSGMKSRSRTPQYKHVESNSVSMEPLTSAGKQMRATASEHKPTRPQDLFFSPTAHARDSSTYTHRNSGYMPAGYYAGSGSQAAGGAPDSTMPGSISPYAQTQQHRRQSTQGSQSLHHGSRDEYRTPTRDARSSQMYANPSSSSLMVGQSDVSRAPSAYLEDLFDSHGARPGHF